MHLSETAGRTPDRPAVVMSDGSRTTTYAEMDERSRRVAALLHGHGVRQGDHVALVMDNVPEFLEVAWGAQRAGTLWTPVNWHLTEDEAAYVVGDCGARVLFASEDTADLASRIVARTPALEAAYVAGDERTGLRSYATARDSVPSSEAGVEVEGSYFFYASGTTGKPKGIKPTHAFPPFGTGLTIDHV